MTTLEAVRPVDTRRVPELSESGSMARTVLEIVSPYLQDRVKRREISHSKARDYRRVLVAFGDHCGKRPIPNISPVDVESWTSGMGHLAPATVRVYLSAVRGLFTWAIRHGYCRRNPALEVQSPKQPRTIPRGLSVESARALLLTAPDERGRLICGLMLQQGLRCIEVARMDLGDIDFGNGTMLVTGKGHHERVLPITDETRVLLDAYLYAHPAAAGPLIRSYQPCGRRLSAKTISMLVADWCWQAGIKRRARDGVSAHAGRHTCAGDMLRLGAHVRDVQAVLGHRHLATTEIYLPLLVRGLSDAMGGRSYA
jgi:integrase/recombinase XerC